MSLILAALPFTSDPPPAAGAIYNLPDGQALLLLLGLIFLVALALLYNARAYRPPASLAHGSLAYGSTHAAAHTADEHADQPPETRTRSVAEDDLTIIEGIGPKTRSVFRAAGLTTFAQIAEANTTDLDRILDAAGLRLGDPATWPDQARLAAAGDRPGLRQLQAELKGGRRPS